VPRQILGPSGYLALKQNGIESMRLITDGSCDYALDEQFCIDLSALRNLRKIAWTGLRSANEIETLADALRANSTHLAELELDLISWDQAAASLYCTFDEDDDTDTFLVRQILGLLPGEIGTRFRALTVLFGSLNCRPLHACSFIPSITVT
jgi:hypothetical protein